MITIVAKITLKEGMKRNFIEATRDLIEGSRKEEGNISYDLYEDIDSEHTMCFIENWRDAAAIAAHNASPHFLKWTEVKGSVTAGGEVIKYRKL